MRIGYLMQAGVANVRQRPLSGPANHVKQVYDELRELGHQMCLLAYLDGEIWKSYDLEHFDPVKVGVPFRDLLRCIESAIRRVQYELRLPYAAFFESLRFAQACRQELSNYDLLYERMGWMGYGGGLAARWLKIPLILEVNGDHLNEMKMLGVAPHGMQRRLSIALTKKAIGCVSHVISTGEGWRISFIERWGTEPSKVTVVENGSEVVDLLKRDQLRSFRRDSKSKDPITMIYIGAFEPWHGLTILLRAVAKVIDRGVPLRLILVGTGTEMKQIRELVCDLEIEMHVTLTGLLAATQFASYLAKAEIGVSPYCGRVEYSGLKLLDYKAAGLATIASGTNGQPAVLDHGRTGWIVPPCDEGALCQAIIQLATDAELRKRIGREARIEAEKYHRWHNTAMQLNDVFEQIVTK